jgi:hypothetical protein
MIDYLLKFEDRTTAVMFGLQNGFATIDEDGNEQITLASHEYALHVIGEHNGADYWVLFRDLAGIPIPEGAEQFIFWASNQSIIDDAGSEISIPRPEFNPDVPNTFWA